MDIGARANTPFSAAAAGVVTHAGPAGDYGLLVTVDHGGGLTTRYAHANELNVKIGHQVKAGEQLGKVGTTGSTTGPHLHFEV